MAVTLEIAADEALVRVSVGHVDAPHLKWAEGEQVSLPRRVAELFAGCIAPDGTLEVTSAALAEGGEAARLRERAAFTDTPPASSTLPFSYQLVPASARALIANMVGRWQRRAIDRWARFPGFPLDLSADFVADLEQPARPAPAIAPVLLSHDIDSPEGLRNLVDRFLPLEETVGARSVNFIVPRAWAVDPGLVAEVRSRGHAVGVHGFDHSNRTPFCGAEERRRRLAGAGDFITQYDARGYRAPSLLRTRALLRDLGGLYEYDSSIPTAGGLFPVPNNGCATARPFRIEGIAEIPVSLPRDGSLRFLGYSPSEIADIWMACATRIARARGVVMLLTHCERRFSGTAPMVDAYSRFLHFAAQSNAFVFASAGEVAASVREAA